MLVKIQLHSTNFMFFYYKWNFNISEEIARYVRHIRMERICSSNEYLGRQKLSNLSIIKAVISFALCNSQGEANLIRMVI